MTLDSPNTRAAWAHALRVTRPALLLCSRDFLTKVRDRLATQGIQDAVANRNSARIGEWMLGLANRQGVSNNAAVTYANRQDPIDLNELTAGFSARPCCPLLRSRWHFDGCDFRKTENTCARPFDLPGCPVPHIGARKGTLSMAAVALALFIRDVAGDDLVGWIDRRLAAADRGVGVAGRAAAMRAALLEPLMTLPGFGAKVASMILSELLIGGDPLRERWVTTGVSFVAVDRLIHNFLARTGILRRLDREHAYGPICHSAAGCLGVVVELAERIDARDFNRAYPVCFPRMVQWSLWAYCAEGMWNICSANKVGSGEQRCINCFCSVYAFCDAADK